MVLSHAHIDHTGLIPRLVAARLQRPYLYCISYHRSVREIMLMDSAEDSSGTRTGQQPTRQINGQPELDALYSEVMRQAHDGNGGHFVWQYHST